MDSEISLILKEILVKKKKEIKEKSKSIPVSVIENLIADGGEISRGFYNAILKEIKNGKNAIIAEIKRASLGKSIIYKDFDPAVIAKSYEDNGATCLSVSTDENFFYGSELHLEKAKNESSLPILRRDFIIDEYQVYESCAMGADCILLIASCLTNEELMLLTRLSYDLGMDVLVEVHNKDDLDKLEGIPLRMICINNRDLHTFDVDLTTTIDLSISVPEEILIVTESGITTKDDITLMNSIGIESFLVGESFMRSNNPGKKLAEMFK